MKSSKLIIKVSLVLPIQIINKSSLAVSVKNCNLKQKAEK